MNITEMLLYRAAAVSASLPEHLREARCYTVFFVVGDAAQQQAIEAGAVPSLDLPLIRAGDIEPVYVLPSTGSSEIRGRTALHAFTVTGTPALDASRQRTIANALLTTELALKCLHSSLYGDLQLSSGVQQ